MKAPSIALVVSLATIFATPNIVIAEQITSTPVNLPSIAKLKIQLDSNYYRSSGNQFIEGNEQLRGTHPFECVEFAYGRAIERGLFQNKQGIGRVFNGDAHTWVDRVANSPYRGRVKNTVRANSFVVWAADLKFQWSEGSTTYTASTDAVAGHVAFVEKVYPDGSFVVSEMSRHEAKPIIRLIRAKTPVTKAAKFIYL
jgi:surface antigen